LLRYHRAFPSTFLDKYGNELLQRYAILLNIHKEGEGLLFDACCIPIHTKRAMPFCSTLGFEMKGCALSSIL